MQNIDGDSGHGHRSRSSGDLIAMGFVQLLLRAVKKIRPRVGRQ